MAVGTNPERHQHIMSHELEILDGRATFVGKVPAWHRLGTVIGDAFGLDEIEANAPEILMPVEKITPFIYTPVGIKELERTCAIVRADGAIVGEGVGQDSYGIVQSRDAFEFGQELGGRLDKPLVSAGTIRGGMQFFFTYELANANVGGEQVQSHLSVVSSHDGSLSLQAIHSTTVVVCANTMEWALQGATDRVTLKHTSKVEERMEQYLAVRAMAETRTSAVERRIRTLQATEVRNFDLLLDGILPKLDGQGRSQTVRANARKDVRDLYFLSEVVAPYRGTGWGAVQAVNSFEQWVAPVRGKAKGQSEEQLRAVRQFDAIVKGVQPLTARATELVLAGV